MKTVLNLDIENGDSIEHYIETQTTDKLLKIIIEKRNKQGKTHFNQLKNYLQQIKYNDHQIDTIIQNLSCDDDLLLERSNVVLFYRLWKDQKWKGRKLRNLTEASVIVKEEASIYKATSGTSGEQSKILDKNKMDFIDILARENREDIPYYGLDKLIKMSCGTPRIILNILKHAFRNEFFEKQHMPFLEGHNVSIQSQMYGIGETIDWFYEENRIPSNNGNNYVDALIRLGTYLRKLRFSCVPPESSISCFSIVPEKLSEKARNTFEELESHSYLINVNQRRDKNTGEQRKGYQINLALLPKWDLPLAIRGVLELDKDLAEFIFNLDLSQEDYEKVINAKMRDYYAPFSGFKVDPLPLMFKS